eukprot:3080919-Rhodomonas_salina.1
MPIPDIAYGREDCVVIAHAGTGQGIQRMLRPLLGSAYTSLSEQSLAPRAAASPLPESPTTAYVTTGLCIPHAQHDTNPQPMSVPDSA